jgi:alpha-1,3-rhamnosyl/mannosyltransferase
MRIAAYTSPLEAWSAPTGVGQHILGMFSALQQREDVAFNLVTPRDRGAEALKFIAAHSRSRMLPLPWPDRALRLSTTWMSLLKLDPWLDDSDWVYTPAEHPVTTSRRLAVTVHDVYPFEPEVRGLPRKRPAGLSWQRRMTRILRRADLIATVSEFTRSRILELFDVRHPERVVVIGNGGSEGFSPTSQPDDARVLRRYGLHARGYVLFPASLTRRKGGDLLLDVARLAQAERAGLTFAVIGRRHDADLLEALCVMREQVPGLAVTLLGYVTKPDLSALYRHAQAAFLPSRYEGFGIPVVEALASGCPMFITGQAALVEVAAGRAHIVQPDAAAVLAALTEAETKTSSRPDGRDRTWAQCAGRLVQAMESRSGSS